MDRETIGWSATNLSRGITFAYFPPRYAFLQSVLSPFVGLSSLGRLAMMLGFVFGLVMNHILRAVLSDAIKNILDRSRKAT